MFQEILVTDFISDFSKLTDEQIQRVSKDVIGSGFIRNCPNGTIIGIKIGRTSDLQKRVYFPFFSHISMPINPGERAWVFDPGNSRVSYWLSRKVQEASAEDLNFTNDDNARLYSALTGDPEIREKTSSILFDANASGVSLSDVRNESIALPTSVGEAVIPVQKEASDLVIQGSNNTAIKLGNLGEEGTGTIDLVSGIASTSLRKTISNSRSMTTLKPPSREDENYESVGLLGPEDESRIVISRSFNADDYYDLPGDDSGKESSISVKSKNIRIIANNDTKVVVGPKDSLSTIVVKNDGNIIVTPASTIKLSGDFDNQPFLRYDDFRQIITGIENICGSLQIAITSLAAALDSVSGGAASLATQPSLSTISQNISEIEAGMQTIKSQKILGS